MVSRCTLRVSVPVFRSVFSFVFIFVLGLDNYACSAMLSVSPILTSYDDHLYEKCVNPPIASPSSIYFSSGVNLNFTLGLYFAPVYLKHTSVVAACGCGSDEHRHI